MKKKLLALFLVLTMVLAMIPVVNAQATFAVKVVPSVSTAKVGDTVEYSVYATGDGITALQFNIGTPEGMTFVSGSGAVPADLKTTLGWAATDWTEKTETETPMIWTGYTDLPTTFPKDTLLMTFSCTFDAVGEYEVNIYELLPFDENYEEFPADLNVGKVTVTADEEPEVTEPEVTEPEVTEPEAPESPFMIINVKADDTEVNVGETIKYTVTAYGDGITALQFNIGMPEGMTFVSGSGAVPADLKTTLGWAATDWTEKTETETPMIWTGYTDLPTAFPKDIVLMTFSCTADAAGEYVVNIYELLPFDENYEEFPATLNVDTVTVIGGGETECEHSFTNYVSNGDATCTDDGTKTAKCDKCDETKTVADEGSALGHDMGAYVSNNDADCTNDGTKTSKCSRCDETKTIADEGSALGHDMGAYVADNNATCTGNGTETSKCSRCDETDTREIPDSATGHSFTNYVYNGDATCTENGTETAKCDNCDETSTRTAADSATGHNLTLVPATVTCTEAGNIAYYICENCHLMFADGTGSVVVDADDIKADALGHIDEDGDKACDRCGYTDEPEVTEPEVTEPEVTEPEVTEPEVTEPEVTEPEVTEPEVTEPEVTEPEVTEPEVTEPEVTEPEVTEPEVTEPEATTKPTTKPGADDEENPKTDNDNMLLSYFAVMMVAAIAVLVTVLLGKKKYMA